MTELLYFGGYVLGMYLLAFFTTKPILRSMNMDERDIFSLGVCFLLAPLWPVFAMLFGVLFLIMGVVWCVGKLLGGVY